ncbi:MAG: hypothetical protein H6667_26205 [Ardenticatenaceae bacterium]|nr:hypothetical protein [Ardenticatenaceae bacterium]MCB9444283.1 hypothetical protein [Ardenticatenaceae bacterium]
MSENATQKNWMVILTILLLGALVIAGPLLTGQIGPDAQKVQLPLPFAIGGSNTLALASWQAALGLLVIIIGAIAIVGAGISFLFSRAEKQTADVLNSKEFQASKSAFDKLDADRVKKMNEDRETAAPSPVQRPGWSAVSTSLVVILFAVFAGMLVNSAFIPDGEYVVDGRTASGINVTLIWIALISFFIIIVRSRLLQAQSAEKPVSWDIVWITATGLFVVGAGLTAVLYLSGQPDVERAINSAVPVVGGFALTALLILAWRIRPQQFQEIEQTDNSGIPWDFIWILISGLLVVGLGLSVTAYLNSPF